MEIKLPKQTHDIFAAMAKGHFISSNGTKDGTGRLYDVINNPENFDNLQEYFYKFVTELKEGTIFFYFSKLMKQAV